MYPDPGRGWLAGRDFPDVPEAGTDGKTRGEALALAEDALGAALTRYVHTRRDNPAPNPLAKGQYLVPLTPIVAAKMALDDRLGISETAVRKLVNPDHRTDIGPVETALKAQGRSLVVEDKMV